MTHIVCKVCGTALDAASAVRCLRCETPHHPECLEYGQGCSVYGCDPKVADRLDKPRRPDGPRKSEWIIPSNALGEFSSLYMGLPMIVVMLVIPIMNCSSPAVSEIIAKKVEQQLKEQRSRSTSPSASPSLSQLPRDVEVFQPSPSPGASPASVSSAGNAPCPFDEQGFDCQGYDRHGYDRSGFNRDGFDRDGYTISCWDSRWLQFAANRGPRRFGKDGYDQDGFDQEGIDRTGFCRQGYDREGYDRSGFDRSGYDRAGVDRKGFDRKGVPVPSCGDACFGSGYARDGFNRKGIDREGHSREWHEKQGTPACFPKNRSEPARK